MISKWPSFLTVQKKLGETPLIALERLRLERGIPDSIPLAYAGRLDPMATGTLLILIGEACKIQEQYHTLDKEYEFEILLGAHSDTGDVLGLINFSAPPSHQTSTNLKTILNSLRGKIELPYPSFSSKTVRGKPLHTWALENRLNEIEIPVKRSHIYSIHHEDTRVITSEDLKKEIHLKIESIQRVTDPKKALGADFRRDIIRESWKSFFEMNPSHEFQILQFRCIASSGTYMRSLAEVIGAKLNTEALAFSIHRTKIGTYKPFFKNIGFWAKTY